MSKKRPKVEEFLPQPDSGPAPLPSGFPRWKSFAWDGWQAEIPVEWDLGALEVSPKGGYFRIDDEFEPRLMVRWQPLKGNFDPEKAIARHFIRNYPSISKNHPDVRPRIGASLPGLSKTFRGLDYKTYSLRFEDHRSVGLAAHCPDCQRAFVAEMNTTEKGGAGERLIRRVLGTFSDHPRGKLKRWEFFGLSLDLPRSLTPVAHRFNQGYLYLSVAEPGTRVDVSRWTLANIHMAKVDLEKFLHLHFLKKRNAPRFKTEEAFIHSHKGVLFHTSRKYFEPARAFLRRTLRFRQPAYRTGMLWHCTASNRLLLFQLGSNKARDVGTLRLMASRLRCCKVIY